MNVAVIDLGSNTFHLLIVEILSDFSFKEVYRHRVFTGLCEGGIDSLLQSSIEFGIETCKEFKSIMDDFGVINSLIAGTAALRTASNNSDFIVPAEQILNKKIEIINGLEEAELIFKGIKQLHAMHDVSLIMDIGGGSTEFILVEHGNIIWKNSYLLGVGVLYKLFHHVEPIGEENEKNLRRYIKSQLKDFNHVLKSIQVNTLIGASGSFEVLESMSGLLTQNHTANEIDVCKTDEIIQKIIKANFDERTQMEGLPAERVKYIVVAMVLIDEIVKQVKPKQILVSPYALKEGLIVNLIAQLNLNEFKPN